MGPSGSRFVKSASVIRFSRGGTCSGRFRIRSAVCAAPRKSNGLAGSALGIAPECLNRVFAGEERGCRILALGPADDGETYRRALNFDERSLHFLSGAIRYDATDPGRLGVRAKVAGRTMRATRSPPLVSPFPIGSFSVPSFVVSTLSFQFRYFLGSAGDPRATPVRSNIADFPSEIRVILTMRALVLPSVRVGLQMTSTGSPGLNASFSKPCFTN